VKKRIFIAINLPEEIKRGLLDNEKRWRNLHVRWTSFENLHITVEFLGNVNRSGLESVLFAVERTVCKTSPFYIHLDRIVLGPNKIQPRMFWATIRIDSNIVNLKESISCRLKKHGFDIDNRKFTPHITLARARGNQLKGKQTNILLKDMVFVANTVEVMQSQLYPGGARYKIVESFKFRQ